MYKIEEYNPDMGANPITDEMRETLSGLTIEKQLDFFVIEESTDRYESDYGESDSWTEESVAPLKTQLKNSEFDVKAEKLIVADGILAGVFFYNLETPALLGKWICTYSDSEEDGPYSSSISVSKRLMFKAK